MCRLRTDVDAQIDIGPSRRNGPIRPFIHHRNLLALKLETQAHGSLCFSPYSAVDDSVNHHAEESRYVHVNSTARPRNHQARIGTGTPPGILSPSGCGSRGYETG